MALRVTFAGGGSIGHLAPMVAVWRALKEMRPDAEATFFCSDREADTDYVRSENVPFHSLPSIRRDLRWPWAMLSAYRSVYGVLKANRPDVLFLKGGGVTIPVYQAARQLGIPMVAHESDAIPGRATRFFEKRGVKVIHGFPDNPVRPEIMKGSRERGLALTGFSGARPILLVLGGSQGALALNQAIARHLDALLAVCDVVHITGPGKAGAEKRPGQYWSNPLVYDKLPDLYAVANIALSRSGAGTIAELAACGIPTILVPLQGVAHDHQLKNAETLAARDACILLPQERIDVLLVQTVTQFLTDPVKAKKIGERLHSLHTASASGHIAKVMLSCVATPRSPA